VTALAVRSKGKRIVVAVLIATGLGASLSACGNSGTALAKQACTHINRSIRLLEQSDHQPDHARAAQLAEQAYDQLRAALPIAAQAAFHDGQWQGQHDLRPDATALVDPTACTRSLVTLTSAVCPSMAFGSAGCPCVEPLSLRHRSVGTGGGRRPRR
jgi:hypothetical protein